MIPKELIDKYFRNECSDEEKKLVLEYFRNNPEEWNQYMTEEDWDNFTPNRELDPQLSEKLYKTVSRHSFGKGRRVRMAWLTAAALVGAAAMIALLWINRADKSDFVATTTDPYGTKELLQERRNTTDTLMPVLLADGSEVILSPGSSVRFYAALITDNKRPVFLSGKALFKAAKNEEQPFTVYADKLVTTVLGTSFTVQAFEKSNVIMVKLHDGKVRVAAADTAHAKWKNDVILLPGDELTYDKATMLASVKHSTPGKQMVKAGPANRTGYVVQRPDWYTFETSQLAEVFDQLSSYYQVDIYYYPSDVHNKYFTGRMRKTDSLETILKDIALLNHLTVEQKEGSYIIRKKK
ncbi:FecR family protein [uncultured Chitinophaga sp.]|jgi:Fe2+-dicitrate sensor, membrane component|uniref:FecR family protein n=1 Tax=uncultured Chitinophaga sp. TaxID=339340 RepID=UPI00261171ED|nr:FecR family protein [uncultured Chitinophaga sp.]